MMSGVFTRLNRLFKNFEPDRLSLKNQIKKSQEYIEQHFQRKISIDELAGEAAVGRRNFERRFKQATNNSVLGYVHRVKVEAAKRLLENSRKNINEVMYDIGYTDAKAFRTMFKKLTGLTPGEYRNKYNKMAIEH